MILRPSTCLEIPLVSAGRLWSLPMSKAKQGAVRNTVHIPELIRSELTPRWPLRPDGGIMSRNAPPKSET